MIIIIVFRDSTVLFALHVQQVMNMHLNMGAWLLFHQLEISSDWKDSKFMKIPEP